MKEMQNSIISLIERIENFANMDEPRDDKLDGEHAKLLKTFSMKQRREYQNKRQEKKK